MGAVKAAAGAVKTGVGAVKKAIGQTPPTAQEVRQFLDSKGIGFTQAEQLIKWGVIPHTRMSADALGLSVADNSDHWHDRLRKFIPDNNQRATFIKPFVAKHIGIWIPFMESDSVR